MKACNGSMLGSGGATVCLGGTVIGIRVLGRPGEDDRVPWSGLHVDPAGCSAQPGKIYTALNLYADIGVGAAVVPAVLTPASKDDKAAGYKTTLHVFGSGDPVDPAEPEHH